MQTDATSHNIVVCCWGFWGVLANNVASVCMHGPKSLTGFKQCATSANIVVAPCKRTQHVGPNNVACCWPTMLRPFARTFKSTSNCWRRQAAAIGCCPSVSLVVAFSFSVDRFTSKKDIWPGKAKGILILLCCKTNKLIVKIIVWHIRRPLHVCYYYCYCY